MMWSHLTLFWMLISDTPNAGLIIGSITTVLALLIIAAVIGFLVFRKRFGNKKEEERSDINPVYGTYEVHDDPVAEVGTFKSLLFKEVSFQVEDQNMEYGVVYEGNNTSKTTDVNSEYEDYDDMS